MRDTIAVPLTTSTATKVAQLRSMKLGVLGRHRSIPHLGRKAYHLVMGLVCFSLYAFLLTREQALLTLATVGGVWVVCDLLRLRFSAVNALALRIFGGLMRREELKGISANTYYIWGMFTVVLFFPKPIVLLSLLYLAVGDPVAAMVGTLYGRHRFIAGKSVEGAAANFLASGVVTALAALFYFHLPVDRSLTLAIVGGVVSAVAELIPLPINDNFTIPVLSAMLLTLVTRALPLF